MLIKNRIFIVGLISSVVLFFPACNKTWDDHYNTLDVTTQKDKVISELEKIPEISEFTEAVKQVDTLVDLLNQNRLYTVFAPVNETFNAIDPEILNDETLFTRMMLYHFVDGKYKYKDLSYEDIETFNNKFLNVSFNNENKVLFDGSATILQQDFLSQNGMIQVIDRPLLPKNNLYEYFVYNTYSSQFAGAILEYTIKEFNQAASEPVGKNDKNEVIYDSVFTYSNPLLSWNFELDAPLEFYGNTIGSYVDITDETELYTCVFPVDYETALSTVKSSSFLNASISDHHWAGPILSSLMFSRLYPFTYFAREILSNAEYMSTIFSYHAQPEADSIKVLLYFADLLSGNYTGSVELSNGVVHLVDGFEYDMGWLITDQGNLKDETTNGEKEYRSNLMSDMTTSDNVDTVFIESNNIKTIFYQDTSTNDYSSAYNEWVSFEFEGSFYPVDYKILVRGRNVASGTFNVEADGEEIGQFDFSTAPSGDDDTQFDHIGTVSFTEIKSTTSLKFTFVNTHPGTIKGEQYLWIREIKFSPIIK